jgi:hypothetical protein
LIYPDQHYNYQAAYYNYKLHNGIENSEKINDGSMILNAHYQDTDDLEDLKVFRTEESTFRCLHAIGGLQAFKSFIKALFTSSAYTIRTLSGLLNLFKRYLSKMKQYAKGKLARFIKESGILGFFSEVSSSEES